MENPTFAMLQPNILRPNPWNEFRPLTPEFEASIEQDKIITPIQVRPIFKDIDGGEGQEPDGFEIICGERRQAAALKVGLAEVPCTIHDIDDVTAKRWTLIENLRRSDLTPWQQASMLKKMMPDQGFDIAELAANLGWSQPQIRRRLSLLNLSPAWQDVQGKEDNPFKAYGALHLELIARYHHAIQEKVFVELQNPDSRSFTVNHLREELAKLTMGLSGVPWDLKDELLYAVAGACSTCLHRTDAQPELFEEFKVKGGIAPRCTNRPCFDKKMEAHQAKAIHPEGKPKAKTTLGIKTEIVPGSAVTVSPEVDAVAGKVAAGAFTENLQPKTDVQKRAAIEVRRWAFVAEALITIAGKKPMRPNKTKAIHLMGFAGQFGVDGSTFKWASVFDGNEIKALSRLWLQCLDRMVILLREAINNKSPQETAEFIARLLNMEVKKLKTEADAKVAMPKALVVEPAKKETPPKSKPKAAPKGPAKPKTKGAKK